MPAPTDEDLFETYRRGDQAALRTLIDRHHDDLLRFLYRLLGDRQAAEDVFQETFLQVHLRAHTFDATRRFRPWLFTIAANRGRDLLRTRGRKRTLELSAPVSRGGAGDPGPTTFVDLLEATAPAAGAGLEAQERERAVQQAIQQVSPTLREVLLLAYFQRLSYMQIAELMDIPLGTVKSRLHAAVASFAKHWHALTARSAEPDHHA